MQIKKQCHWISINIHLWQRIVAELLLQVSWDMTDQCTADFCIWQTLCLVPVRCISSIRHMYTTDFAYDGPIFLVPLSLSYPSSPVLQSESKVYLTQLHKYHSVRSYFIYNLIYMWVIQVWKTKHPHWSFKSQSLCEKVASDLGLGSSFCWVIWFPKPISTVKSWLNHGMAEKVMKKQNYQLPNMCLFLDPR